MHLRLVRYPARLGGGVRGSQVQSDLDAAGVLDHAISRTRAWGASDLTFWTNPPGSPDLEAELRRRGAEHIDTVAVFALPLDAARVDVPAGVTAEVVRTLDQVREVDTINVPVWEQEPLDDAGLRDELDEVTAASTRARGCAFSAGSTAWPSAPAARRSSTASPGCGAPRPSWRRAGAVPTEPCSPSG